MFFKKDHLLIKGTPAQLPRHIGIIMDGNGRWAKRRGLPRSAGHSAGSSTFKTIATYCNDIGIACLSVYAFSTENWQRPQNEIDAIIKLLDQYLDEAFDNFGKESIRIRFIGDITPLPDSVREKAQRIEQMSRDNPGMRLNIAFNYGGRAEITHALNEILDEIKVGKRTPGPVSEAEIGARLYTADCPPLDLLIRPSGELRILWQCAYAEFWFADVLWPDFKKRHLVKAINDYMDRDRRFGGI